ncbi:MAG: hypothetical protein ACR2RB_03260 [Gammaproteobacteria bacterium]
MKKFSRGLLLSLAFVSTAALAVVAIGAWWIVPQFVELFDGFSSELPFVTNVVVYSYPYWLIFPAITLVAGTYIARRNEFNSRQLVASVGLFVGGFALAFVLLGVSVWAFYAPIVQLSEAQ